MLSEIRNVIRQSDVSEEKSGVMIFFKMQRLRHHPKPPNAFF
jgi:hypothetical protein